MLGKVVSLAVSPLHLFFFLALTALLLKVRKRERAAAWTMASGVLVLLASSIPLVSGSLLGSLEKRWPPVAPEASPEAEAIVLLGGYLSPAVSPRITPDFTDASDRLIHAARLFRAKKAPLVIATGGNAPWTGVKRPESEAAAHLLAEFGVPAGAVIVEGRSISTRENAAFTAQLTAERKIRRVLLVTSASHMTRSVAVFRKAGFEVIPAPTDHRSLARGSGSLLPWLWPDPQALEGTTAALHEYVGLLYYRLRGWI